MNDIIPVRPPVRPAVDRLHLFPNLGGNDRFMCVLFNNVFAFRYLYRRMVFIRKMRRAVLRQRAGISLVFEDARNRFCRPGGAVAPFRLFPVQPRIVRRGIRNALVGESPRDRPHGSAFQPHIVNAPHDPCRLLVDDRRAVFVRAHPVTVGVRPVCVPARLPFGFEYGADFFGRIRRVPLVEHIHNGHHIHARARAVGSVYIVRKRDKADAVSGENVVDILPDLNVISSEARQVFYDNGIDFSVLGVVQKPFYARAFEVRSRPAVVDVFVYDGAAVF